MTTPNSRKRKRQNITLAEKQEIIEAPETKSKVSDLATRFNNKYKYTAIDGILKSKDKIQKAIEDGSGGKRVTLKGSKNSNLEEALLKWLKDVRSENIAVDGPMLKEKAIKLAELLEIEDFKASNGWLDNFKERHGIVFKNLLCLTSVYNKVMYVQ